MIAVGAGVREHVELQCRQFSALVGARLHCDAHRMPGRGRDELFLAGELKFYGPSGLDGGQCQNILDEHFLLAAEAAADAFAKQPNLVRGEIENLGQRTPRQERHLRAGTDVQDPGRIDPCETAMGLQRSVLNALGRKRSLVGDRGLGKGAGDIAVFSMRFRHDVALRIGYPLLRRLVAVNHGRALFDRLRRIDHRGQNVVFDLEAAAAFLGGGFGLCDHSGDLLPDEADDIVQHAGIVRVHPVFLVPRGRKEAVRRIFESQCRMDAGNAQRRCLVDRDDSGVRMRRAQNLDVQQAFDNRIEGVGSCAPHELRSGGGRQAAAECGAGCRVLNIVLAIKGVFDRTIAGASAQIAFQRCAEILPLRLIK